MDSDSTPAKDNIKLESYKAVGQQKNIDDTRRMKHNDRRVREMKGTLEL